MQWIFILFIILIIGAIGWAIVELRRERREDEAIFNQYLDNERKLKFSNRGKVLRSLKRRL